MVKVSKGGGNILRGATALLGMTIKNPETRAKIEGLGNLAADSLEDGVEIEIVKPRIIRGKREAKP